MENHQQYDKAFVVIHPNMQARLEWNKGEDAYYLCFLFNGARVKLNNAQAEALFVYIENYWKTERTAED